MPTENVMGCPRAWSRGVITKAPPMPKQPLSIPAHPPRSTSNANSSNWPMKRLPLLFRFVAFVIVPISMPEHGDITSSPVRKTCTHTRTFSNPQAERKWFRPPGCAPPQKNARATPCSLHTKNRRGFRSPPDHGENLLAGPYVFQYQRSLNHKKSASDSNTCFPPKERLSQTVACKTELSALLRLLSCDKSQKNQRLRPRISKPVPFAPKRYGHIAGSHLVLGVTVEIDADP
jgi:hypothetical protein